MANKRLLVRLRVAGVWVAAGRKRRMGGAAAARREAVCGRCLAEQEINLSLEQARALGELR
jgi:hypothetical protein